MQKSDLRREFKARTADFIKRHEKPAMDEQLAGHLSQLIAELNSVAVFWALPDEPHPLPFLNPKKKYVLPRVEGDNLGFYQFEPDAELMEGPWRIREPDPKTATAVKLEQISGVCVPGVAFDRDGRRLGRGKGFYDRALLGYQGKKIGVGYSVQVSDEPLPHEPHDVRMDWIVTEKGYFQPRGMH